MGTRTVAAGLGVALAGVIAGVIALTHLDRLREVPANIRRYSMPSASVYDLVTHLGYGRRYQEIAAAIAAEAPTGAVILDVGSGSGEVLVRLAALAPSLRLTGVDVDPGMLGVARRKAARQYPGGAGPSFVHGDAAALPVEDESVDMVVSSFAAHHLPDREAALAEMMRVLRPGGRVVIWDIVSPHGHGSTSEDGHEGSVAKPATHSVLGTLRMMARFGRLPAQRYEFAKAARVAPTGD